MGFSISRWWSVVVKEFIQFRRDHLTFGVMLTVPLLELILFGFAINTDARQLPTAVLDFAHDRFSRSIVASLETTDYFRIENIASAAGREAGDGDALLKTGKYAFVLVIPSDLGQRALRGEKPEILVEADATDPAASGGAINALLQIADSALQGEVRSTTGNRDSSSAMLRVIVHRHYNPEGLSKYNIVPGLLGVILEMSMMITVSMAVTRETERGTMEMLLALPTRAPELMFGKIAPYIAMGLLQTLMIIKASQIIFATPLLGSAVLLISLCLGFIVCMVLLGYALATLVRTQMQAMQVATFYFLPSLLLSGFTFPFRGMPAWAQAIGETLPLTHFMRISRAIMLKGAGLAELSGEIGALFAFTLGFAAFALLRSRRTLD